MRPLCDAIVASFVLLRFLTKTRYINSLLLLLYYSTIHWPLSATYWTWPVCCWLTSFCRVSSKKT